MFFCLCADQDAVALASPVLESRDSGGRAKASSFQGHKVQPSGSGAVVACAMLGRPEERAHAWARTSAFDPCLRDHRKPSVAQAPFALSQLFTGSV
ncbi:hypothetical protein AAFF_G00059010 [Aldrovandia affinis]|uniref:Uncharacterized protein n=1 Tax=Aldrovandia affinis TaxID=143900 RepID=A0AAD7S0U1_9TELE|nr:hypothetical protein AAFF_G00059010 [Aldrovandia affinis]